MLVFFAAVGAQAGLPELLALGAQSGQGATTLAALAGISLGVHAGLLLLMSCLANALLRRTRLHRFALSPEEVLVASNANVGGAATAAAFAGAGLGRADLVVPATCCGLLGYTLATAAGVNLAHLLGA
eukprot:TRINITY_DN113210_c0_g1_i1.p1 TRINITY_DN113210_c0_g1~~TRINITY_DN113210_c0_g1_i1.p1  ORF type:complete len:128 (+),score=20.61 TRINITY_DN113210_c0_g1_i1:291-674(+)